MCGSATHRKCHSGGLMKLCACNTNSTTEQLGALALKGITQAVVAYNVPLTASQPALRVIEGGPQSV